MADQDTLHKELFVELANNWDEETMYISSCSVINSCPSYLRIISYGTQALPFIFEDLKTRRHRHWFAALKAITGIDPIPTGMWGKIAGMTEVWIEWLDQNIDTYV